MSHNEGTLLIVETIVRYVNLCERSSPLSDLRFLRHAEEKRRLRWFAQRASMRYCLTSKCLVSVG
jgi:hypothetical protein